MQAIDLPSDVKMQFLHVVLRGIAEHRRAIDRRPLHAYRLFRRCSSSVVTVITTNGELHDFVRRLQRKMRLKFELVHNNECMRFNQMASEMVGRSMPSRFVRLRFGLVIKDDRINNRRDFDRFYPADI